VCRHAAATISTGDVAVHQRTALYAWKSANHSSKVVSLFLCTLSGKRQLHAYQENPAQSSVLDYFLLAARTARL
jgi:hypothetical protein